MRAERKLPLRLYQGIALSTLVLPLGIWLYWLLRGCGLYLWLAQRLAFLGVREGQVLGATFAFIPLFLLWLIPISLLRAFTELPPFSEALRPSPGVSVVRAIRARRTDQQRQQTRMLTLPVQHPERVRFFRRLGAIGIGVGLVALLVTWIAWYLGGGLWDQSLAVALVGLLGGAFSLITGRALIFDTEKVQHIGASVQRAAWIILAAVLVFLAIMCVVTSW